MTELLGRLLRPLRANPARGPLAATEMHTPATISLTSPDFADGTPMPASSAGPGVGNNISPTLQWTKIPVGTAQLVLLLDDIDVPLPAPLIHSAAVLDPASAGLAAGQFHGRTAGVRVIATRLSKDGYSGPRPIPGHGPHRYRFHLLASDIAIPENASTVRELLSVLAGHVLAHGTLTGTYER
jgi:phosphatidylethanolamine-binding protein (PEBP) family uncharacterized protein